MKRIPALLLGAALLLSTGCTAAPEATHTTTGSVTETTEETIVPDKLIALTFDDGPNNTIMVQIAEKLNEYNAKGTFFLIGKQIDVNTEYYVRKVHKMGHELGNHSYAHVQIPSLTDDQIREDFEKTQKYIENITGQRPAFYRPPFIAFNSSMVNIIDIPFAGGITGGDGTGENIAADTAWRITSQAYDGCIVLLHCAPNNGETLKALDTILPELRKQGYEFVTISELFARKGVTAQAHSGILYIDPTTAN